MMRNLLLFFLNILCPSLIFAQYDYEALHPFTEEEVTFQNGESIFSGTLAIPTDGDKHPAMILISGSGMTDRDENIFGFKPFKMIAQHFAQHGIAVLRYDDRGAGKTEGKSEVESTFAELAQDVEQAIDFLKKRPEIDAERIGLMGHSAGGVIAPLVASENSEVAFIILMAGTGVKGEELLIEQVDAILKANGVSDEDIKSVNELNLMIYQLVEQVEDKIELQNRIEEVLTDNFEKIPEIQRANISDKETFIDYFAAQQVEQLHSPWFRDFLAYDPKPALEKVKCPTLLLFGGLDTQVTEAQNRPPMETALTNGGNTDIKTIVFPQANHLFQEAKTGSPNEYATLKKEFISGFLHDLGMGNSALKRQVISSQNHFHQPLVISVSDFPNS